MATVTPFSKRLCLSKDNVYIDLLEAAAPNVLNGVRFLYKKFVQKPGVIINDPPGCEQETQVVMFLRGIHKGLDQQAKPVLILCHSSKLPIWMDCLMKWMPDYDDIVAIDYAKPTTKKSIYVITTDRLDSYCRRDWGIAVIDDDAFLQYKLSPNTFRVLFKIYITTDDLRDYLPKFAQIYKWLYPGEDLDIDQFKPKKHNINDFVEKRIWFSAFAEDIIVRCDKQGPNVRPPDPVEPTPMPRITRKNKDATGTKIKRTKRKVEDDNTESASKRIVEYNNSENNSNDTCASKVDVNNREENMDIESFIREREPIKLDELKFLCIPLASDKNNVVEENSDDMKLNYSDDIDTDDPAYSLDTLEDELDNNELESKESNANIINNDTTNCIEEEARADNLVEDAAVKNTTNCDVKQIVEKNIIGTDNDVEEKQQSVDLVKDTKEIIEETSELNNLADANELESSIKSNDEHSDNGNETKLESKDEVKPVKENGVKKEDTKSDDLDSKWEEMALKKFKGSLLDRIF